MLAPVKGDTNRNPATPAAVQLTGVAETTGAFGGAIGIPAGHASGVGASILAGAEAGGVAVEKSVAEKNSVKPVNPNAEHEFWRSEFKNRPYYTTGTPYEQYGPAYQYGIVSYAKYKGKTFNDVEPQLGREWESRRGQSQLSWNHSKDAAFDAWQRVEKAAYGDSCSLS
jgi:hypothetical protein